jgi:hypothetical protein
VIGTFKMIVMEFGKVIDIYPLKVEDTETHTCLIKSFFFDIITS